MTAQDKKIGLFSAVIIQTNAMIGAGIVAIPAILVQATGSIGILAYLLCILTVLCMTFSFGELSLLHGGQAWCYRFPYVLGGQILGRIGAFCYVVGVLIALGLVAKEAGVWLHESVSIASPEVLTFCTVLVLSLLVFAGKNVSAIGQYVYSGIIFLGILLTSGICFAHFDSTLFFQDSQKESISLLGLTPALLFSFLGFESITSLYTLVANPRKNVFIGGIIGVVAVGVLYVTFSTSVVGSISPEYFHALSKASLANVLSIAFPRYGFISQLLYVGGLFAIIGTLHSMIWSVSVLIGDITGKVRDSVNGFWLFVVGLIVVVSAHCLTNKTIIDMSVLLISASYTLSLFALLKSGWSGLLNRVVNAVGIIGGFVMMAFSFLALIRSLI